ncbi:putative zinc-binding dehydrogenase [Escherichia coli]|uniref:Putative zinc-binding dehydrogenase n=1 Tax=Escherichia coli TaxID=562 RepID=A0A376Y7A6_ECOLX|nr:putative zinc-binding dehydrogenase [Escherichia coli]
MCLEKRLIMAEQLGATVVINGTKEDTISRCQQFTEDMGADIVFETAGSAVTIKQAPYLVMRGGKIMIVGTVRAIRQSISSKSIAKSLSRRVFPLCQSLSGHD